MRTIEIEDGGCIPCSPEIEAKARALAVEKYGHRDVNELIVCKNGAKVPVWQFYVVEVVHQQTTEGK